MFFNRNSDMYIKGSRGQGVKGSSEKPPNPKVIIITDGSHEMGMGHIMRCLSLANVLRNENIDVIFYPHTQNAPPFRVGMNWGLKFSPKMPHPLGWGVGVYCGEDAACKKIESERLDVIRAGNIDKAIDDEKPKVLFIDLPPHINRSCYIDSAKKRGIVGIAFDDMLINGEKTDVIINPSIVKGQGAWVKGQEIGGSKKLAPCPLPLVPFVYSGAEYAVINDSFINIKHRAKDIRKKCRNVLITMGGSDPSRQTEKILNALLDLNLSLNIEVVIGMAYKDKSGVRSWESGVRIHKDIRNMSELMIKADMAFVAGGITLYEAAFVGLPVIVIAQDRYQEAAAMEFQKRGFSIYLGFFRDVTKDMIYKGFKELFNDYDRRKSMSDAGRKIVDGKGVFRVAEIIKRQGLGISG